MCYNKLISFTQGNKMLKKKPISILLSLLMVICLSVAFVGCDNKPAGEDSDEAKACIYNIDFAYERGWIDEDDLKSIACRHYEIYGTEENPYAGMFTQKTEIELKAESDIKNVFCDKFNNEDRYESKPIIEPSDVEIVNYYGTYEGNVVAEINYGNAWYFNEKQVGGVVFDDYKRDIYVLHYFENRAESVKVTGKIYDAATAYKNGWIDQKDLKSIACGYYEWRNSNENPYNGMYLKPQDKLSKETRNELKKAYLEQILQIQNVNLESAYINKYFGTYNGKIVVGIEDEYCKIGAVAIKEIDGITNQYWSNIYVYQFSEQ